MATDHAPPTLQPSRDPGATDHPSAPHAPPGTPPPRPPSRRSRWLGAVLVLLVVAGLAGGGWYLLKRPPAQHAGGPMGPGGFLVTVQSAVARRAELPVTLDALGTVTPLATITLKTQVGGVLSEVLFTEGQMVRKDQLLARIDPRPYEQSLRQAQGTLAHDEAQLEAARVTLARYRTLLDQDSIARQDVDTQAALVRQLEGTVVSDRAAVANAQVNLDYTRITAPVAGRIGLRTVDAGNTVAANATTGIAVITQIYPIDVAFSVPQDRIADILTASGAGQPLAVVALDRNRSGTLDTGSFLTLDNQVDTTTGTVKAKARFSNAKNALFPNQFVNVRFTLRSLDALVVPVTAVRTGPKGNYVYVVKEDRTVEMRPVQRGEATVDVIAITRGLKEGERVVTEGGDRLSDGSRVQLQGDKPAATPARPQGGNRRHRGPGGEGGQGSEGGRRGPPSEGGGAGRSGAPS
ncbi:efflux RND transporter periplasmic adaptor subunit [Xylophilus sp.]|uniref:efflux RND transporter periplasmic adaptor subunit n=1 Tax=Xylophilus sp. TaxID=2653893 RepID=UPI0013B97320|nr:efflux RND transporter periplasmic adaptor subunit [Xylophilus sp.]KAF1043049.1 MAG: Multidrug resistance protein MdtA [Xylophilus sp.]